MAVIDVSKGADVLDKKNQSASPPLLSARRPLGGAEAADQGGFGPRRGGKQGTAIRDIYQMNVADKAVCRKINQMMIQDNRQRMKSLPRPLQDLIAQNSDLANLGIDGRAGKQSLRRTRNVLQQ